MKVVMRRKGNILFSIHGGEVYKVILSIKKKRTVNDLFEFICDISTLLDHLLGSQL